MNQTNENQTANDTGWLNRTVIGAGLTSLLADVAYEMATSVLPGFFALLNLPANLLGFIEGFGDALANFTKLGVGWYSDRIGKRKTLVTFGYFLTGVSLSLFALAVSWPLILLGKSLAWLGKGLRGPLRDAILADSVDKKHLGKTFGFHRAGDTIGAILGPLLGFFLIWSLPSHWFDDDPTGPHRFVFWMTLVPGLLSVIVFAWMIREQRFTPKPGLRFSTALSELPKPYRRYLIGVGVFGMGDFSHTLLLAATGILLAPVESTRTILEITPLLYAWKNLCHAIASYPVGALGDRRDRRSLLALGYLLGMLTMMGFCLTFLFELRSIVLLMGLFAMAGTYLAVQEALEGATTAELVSDRTIRGTAYGILGCVNGTGDFVSSVLVGFLLTVSPVAGFAYSILMMGFGAFLIYRLR
jgi:MFS family permease